jgi:broad specificity phosphatase PhoE
VSRIAHRRRFRFALRAESNARVRRLLLVRHAASAATRAAGFPADEPLDERGRADAARLGAALPARREALSSPALRCRQTAQAAGLEAPAIEPDLLECEFGAWAGRSLADVHAAEPEAARAWMEDPDACPHGGESLSAFADRVAGWLDRQAGRDGAAVAITHGGVVKAALVRALGAPLEAFWRIDVAPLAITELHAHDGRWTVTRVNWTPSGRAVA